MPTKTVFPLLLVYMFLAMLGAGLVIPILPQLLIEFGASGKAAGYLVSAFGLTQFLFSPIAGRFSDKYGRKPMIIGGLILFALSNLVGALFPDVVKVLIEHGADINRRDHMENNPFLYAGAEGYLKILRLTIEAGADPTIFNRFGGIALIPAAEHGYVENVQEILEQTNVDVNHMNKPGWTALLEAIVYMDGGPKYQETIHVLIEHGVDVHLADAKGISPLQHAQSLGFQEISNLLIQAGAKL
ncbi:MFS transporter [Lysinibacillus fusiformis]|uniref:MFS transporter n=1 Tax=Lysinibacillus fusiformis TaxID=28031 RepID=UPI001EF60010|nr:MFS transporter [Lysinibacillus fusiformis]MCG7436190.1 MFS transporter [Lysinibacillus fusiformis]